MGRSLLTGGKVALLVAALAPAPVFAEPIVLDTRDGVMSFEGELQAYDGQSFTVKTSIGVVRIPADSVTCSGTGCPEGTTASPAADAPAPATTIALGAGVSPDLILGLLDIYAAATGASIQQGADGVVTLGTGEDSLSLAFSQGGSGAVEVAFQPVLGRDDGREASLEHVLAIDPIVPITSLDVPLLTISLEDLARIFGGGVSNWSRLGSGSGRIVRVTGQDDPAAAAVLDATILGPAGLALAADTIRAGDVAAVIGSQRSSIGLASSQSRGVARALPIIGSCGLVATADSFSVKAGQYPLLRALTARSDAADLPVELRRFLSFAEGEAAQNWFGRAGYVDQTITVANAAMQEDWVATASKFAEFLGADQDTGALFKELLALSQAGKRLSLTIRAGVGPAAHADGGYRRLAAALGAGEFGGNEVIFVGHTETSGAITPAIARSKVMAEKALSDFLAIAPELAARSDLRFATAAYGGIAPVFCGSPTIEKLVNERVEVWVRPL